MALVNSSQPVLDQSATPVVKVNMLKKHGKVRTAAGLITAANFVGGTVGQWYTFVRIPVRSRVLRVSCTNSTSTTGAIQVGLYRPGGAVINAGVFATAFVLGAANNRAQVDTLQAAADRTNDLATAYALAMGTAGSTGDVEVDIAATIATVIGTPVDTLLEVDYVMVE